MRHVIERAARNLSALEREVLILSANDGLDNAMIAVRLELSQRRVEQVLAAALEKFDRSLDRPKPWWRFW